MTSFQFYPNSLSDSVFEAYLHDTHRFADYSNVKVELLPELFESIDEFSLGVSCKFKGTNRFEGQHPAIRIQSPVGFVPDVIFIEFPPRHASFCIKQDAHTVTIYGLEDLAKHLRVMLLMGLAHWHPM